MTNFEVNMKVKIVVVVKTILQFITFMIMFGPPSIGLVPTAPDWPAWVGHMVTTHFDLVSGLSWAPGGPKRAPFGPKCPLALNFHGPILCGNFFLEI